MFVVTSQHNFWTCCSLSNKEPLCINAAILVPTRLLLYADKQVRHLWFRFDRATIVSRRGVSKLSETAEPDHYLLEAEH